MLVLTRKVGSVVRIGDDIEVEVLSMTIMPHKSQNRADLAIRMGEFSSIETVFESTPFTLRKNVHLQVFNFGNDQLRMGITAPKDVKIVRAEIAKSE